MTAPSGSSNQTGWRAQVYNVSAEDARGPFGKSARLENVVLNPMVSLYDWGGVDGVHGDDPGLQMWVRSQLVDGQKVSISELASDRDDMEYGSFRIGMKSANVSGTCAAFFFVSLPVFVYCLNPVLIGTRPSTATTPQRSISSYCRDR